MQRAEEIEKVERKVAYYCRLYAVDQVRLAHEARFNLLASNLGSSI